MSTRCRKGQNSSGLCSILIPLSRRLSHSSSACSNFGQGFGVHDKAGFEILALPLTDSRALVKGLVVSESQFA